MGPDELAEWEAYHFFEPFGPPADDDRWSILYTLTHRAHFEQKGGDIDWLDRDPEETARIAAKIAASITLEDRIFAVLGGFNVIEADEQP